MTQFTKITHNTFLFELDGCRVLTDPGKYNIEEYTRQKNLNYLIITDTHADHYNKDGILRVLEQNSEIKLIITQSVKEQLESDFPNFSPKMLIISAPREITVGGLTWYFGVEKHIKSHLDIPQKDIMFYQISDKVFIPGDTFALPNGEIDLMGITVIAPFGSMELFIDHVLKCKPKRVFNMHDGYLNKDFVIGFYGFVKKYLEENGINYELVNDGHIFEL